MINPLFDEAPRALAAFEVPGVSVAVVKDDGAIAGQTLVAPTAFAELTRAQTVVPIDPFPPELSALTPGFQAYALGWSLRDYRGRKVVVHTGGVDGMRAIAATVPDERLGVVVLANQEEPITTASCYGILDSFLGGPQVDWIGPGC
jgi:hypothetical protein